MTEAAPKDGSGSPKDAIGGKGPAKLWQIALALTIGAIGGYIFLQLRLPLAWMMGAMVFTTAAAIAGVPEDRSTERRAGECRRLSRCRYLSTATAISTFPISTRIAMR